MFTNKFDHFRHVRQTALDTGLSSFMFDGKTYKRGHTGNIVVYKRVKSKKKRSNKRSKSRR